MPKTFADELGYLTIAQNSGEVDYLKMAYAQALSIKLTQRTNKKYAVIVDKATEAQMQNKYLKVFDHVIVLPKDYAENEEWKMSNEWQVGNLTPFRETIKVEADILFTRCIDHWINAFRFNEICFAEGCCDYMARPSHARNYRTLFDRLKLSDIYSGMYYFKYSKAATEFFSAARHIFLHWEEFKALPALTEFPIHPSTPPSTDLVMALTAELHGVNACRIPTLDFIKFAHMKSAHNGLPEQAEWFEVFHYEQDGVDIRVNNKSQYYPFHYQSKKFKIDHAIGEYERLLNDV